MEVEAKGPAQKPISKSRNSGPHVVKSAARTLQILEFFDEVRCPVNVVTVSEALGYPQSSTSALLRSLVAIGYLQYNQRARTYVPTDRVPLLGSWLNPPLFADGALLRLLNMLAEQTNKLVVLATRNGDHAQYIHVLNAQVASDYQIHLGDLRPLARTAAGLCLLSTLNDKQIKSMYHRMNAYTEDETQRVKVPHLVERVQRVRLTGVAISLSQYRDNLGMVAALLPSACSARPLVVGIGGATEMIGSESRKLVDLLRSSISKSFGELAAATPSWRTPISSSGSRKALVPDQSELAA
ncbi:MAG: helix-turn-helix domain-containing protein [Methylobacteriaceae bacterium]|nr:helix-turn-helix domain-containing protein [Methylobacteriaceae bacterium]